MLRPARRSMLRAICALAPILLYAAPLWAAPDPEAGASRAAARDRIPVGAYCTPASCRADAVPWTAAAFGAAVLVIHRSARARSRR